MKGIDRLSVNEKVALKRSLGHAISTDAPGAMVAFYSAFPGTREGSELPFFLCACGACAMERLDGKPLSFVTALKKLAAQGYSEGTNRKLLALLDTPMEFESLFAAKAGRLLQYMKAKGIKVDFAGLLCDLCAWDRQDSYVQRKWAQEFFGNLKDSYDKEESQNVN